MRHGWLGITVLGALVSLSGTALADHNSKWGEGSANMPNDIHNMRIETKGDNEAFREFVQKGNGADSVNRFATEDDETQSARKGDGGQAERGEAAKGGGNGAANAGSGNGGDGIADRTRTNSRVRTEAHKSAEGAANGSAAQKRDRIRNETHVRNSLRDSARAARGGNGGRGR